MVVCFGYHAIDDKFGIDQYLGLQQLCRVAWCTAMMVVKVQFWGYNTGMLVNVVTFILK
jgi:hypothetical protein